MRTARIHSPASPQIASTPLRAIVVREVGDPTFGRKSSRETQPSDSRARRRPDRRGGGSSSRRRASVCGRASTVGRAPEVRCASVSPIRSARSQSGGPVKPQSALTGASTRVAVLRPAAGRPAGPSRRSGAPRFFASNMATNDARLATAAATPSVSHRCVSRSAGTVFIRLADRSSVIRFGASTGSPMSTTGFSSAPSTAVGAPRARGPRRRANCGAGRSAGPAGPPRAVAAPAPPGRGRLSHRR